MTTNVHPTPPSVRAEVSFPLIDLKLSVDFRNALDSLTGPQLHDIALHAGEVQDEAVVHRLLKLVDDESAQDAYGDYRVEYRRLDRELRNCRGYGLDGDEPPQIVLNPKELVAWLAAMRPDRLNTIALDYYGPDIQLEKVGKRWRWSTVPTPRYILPAELAGRACAKEFTSLRQVEADVTASLNLLPVFEQHLVATA